MSDKNNEMKKDLSKEELSEVSGGIRTELEVGVPVVPGINGLKMVEPGLHMVLQSGKGDTICECGGKDGKCPYCGGTGYYYL